MPSDDTHRFQKIVCCSVITVELEMLDMKRWGPLSSLLGIVSLIMVDGTEELVVDPRTAEDSEIAFL